MSLPLSIVIVCAESCLSVSLINAAALNLLSTWHHFFPCRFNVPEATHATEQEVIQGRTAAGDQGVPLQPFMLQLICVLPDCLPWKIACQGEVLLSLDIALAGAALGILDVQDTPDPGNLLLW